MDKPGGYLDRHSCGHVGHFPRDDDRPGTGKVIECGHILHPRRDHPHRYDGSNRFYRGKNRVFNASDREFLIRSNRSHLRVPLHRVFPHRMVWRAGCLLCPHHPILLQDKFLSACLLFPLRNPDDDPSDLRNSRAERSQLDRFTVHDYYLHMGNYKNGFQFSAFRYSGLTRTQSSS